MMDKIIFARLKNMKNLRNQYALTESHKQHLKEAAIKFWSSDEAEKTRKRISESVKKIYQENPEVYADRFNRHLSEEARNRMSEKMRNYYADESNRARVSELTKEAMKNIPREKLGAKKVKCIELDMIFESSAAAARYFNYKYPNKSHIGDVCNGKAKTTLGYHWEWC